MGENLQSSGDQYIVALRTGVLDDAAHALGNLFQRVYHVTRVARDGLGPYADRMTDTLQQIERLLHLIFDYVSPVEIEMRPVDAARLIESFAAQIRAQGVERVETSACSSTAVLADTRRLVRSFQLLALALAHELAASSGVAIEVAPGSRERVEFLLRVIGSPPTVCEGESLLAWEVAARLIELQGGELVRTTLAAGCTCTVALPMADGDHGTA